MPLLALDSVATLAPLARWVSDPASLPRVPLTTLPTPVEPLERLARASGIAQLWIKRDDASGTLYGGNKPRKLELLLGAARARGRRRVLTFGPIGTHHGLATAICGRAAGLDTTLVLVPQPVTPQVQRCLRLLHACGAELHLASGVPDAARRGLALLARGWLRGEPLEVIPTGGTSSLGALGYVNAGLELAEQVRGGLLPEPAAIFVPLGSGGTVAGLVAGLRIGGLASRVVGVLVTDILPPSARRLLRLARSCLARLGPAARGVALSTDDLEIERGFVGSGYGAVTPEGEAAGRLAEHHQGIALDSTYTAKCLAALLHHGTSRTLRGKPLLFWNTFSSVEPAVAPAPPGSLPAPFRRFL
jgi:D-cysteine desulfhydrase